MERIRRQKRAKDEEILKVENGQNKGFGERWR